MATSKPEPDAPRQKWEAVGAAKDEVKAAFQAIVDAEKALLRCGLSGLDADDLPLCRCKDNKHGKAYAAALARRDEARSEVDAAIQAYKTAPGPAITSTVTRSVERFETQPPVVAYRVLAPSPLNGAALHDELVKAGLPERVSVYCAGTALTVAVLDDEANDRTSTVSTVVTAHKGKAH